ncbi:MAG: BON domain-containing protein [Betaproteobacteria bacterium]|nr:BON domain-containing protein [Betaproteobacteria bacterium]
MKYILALVVALALSACGDDPKPKPAAKPAPPPVAEAPKPAPKPEPPKPDPNKELAALVKRTLEMPENKLPSGAIDVTATDGRVSLWGTVASNGQKTKATQVASKVEGVKSVDNQIKVVRGS